MDFLWFLSELRIPFLEKMMQGLTYFGQEPVLVLLIAIVYWCVNKRLAFRIGLSFCMSGIMVQGLKIIFRIPRPWVLDPAFKPVKSAVKAATGYSFPSGHTQGATSIYGTMFSRAKKTTTKVVLAMLIILVAFSRMFLGVHTPKDVISAILISVTMILVVNMLIRPYEEGRQKLPFILIGIILTGAVVLLMYAGYLYKTDVIELRYVKDCFKATGAAIGFVIGLYLEQKYVHFEEEASMKQQIIKILSGILVIALLYVGIKKIEGVSVFLSMLRNLVVILYLTFVHPYIFTKIHNKKNTI